MISGCRINSNKRQEIANFEIINLPPKLEISILIVNGIDMKYLYLIYLRVDNDRTGEKQSISI